MFQVLCRVIAAGLLVSVLVEPSSALGGGPGCAGGAKGKGGAGAGMMKPMGFKPSMMKPAGAGMGMKPFKLQDAGQPKFADKNTGNQQNAPRGKGR